MFERELGEFVVVPYQAVTKNGHYLRRLNRQAENYVGSFALIAPNNRAIDGEDGRTPYCYESISEAADDVSTFEKFGEYSTCC